jgi:methyl-accepting chemotaxis protein
MCDIAAATAQQSAGIDDASQAVVELEGTTRENVRLVERTAAATDALSLEVGRLVRSVGAFRTAAPVAPATRPAPRPSGARFAENAHGRA